MTDAFETDDIFQTFVNLIYFSIKEKRLRDGGADAEAHPKKK